jgi:hypothetical protein
MKPFLLTLILLSPLAFAEDEFPIELTCEIGSVISFMTFQQDGTGTYSFHNSSAHLIMDTTKIYTFKKAKIALLSISFKYQDHTFTLNRMTGLAKWFFMGGAAEIGSGKCFKGFKEYNETQI